MAGKAAQSVAKAVGEYQYPWREKLAKYKVELSKGVWGYWELGAWKPLGISARRRARLRKETLLAGQDWPYDPERKEMRTKMKGHKCDRISAEKRENTANLMLKMPEMLLAYKKRRKFCLQVFALRDAENATAYVRLEPCNHNGRTPFTEALLKAKVKRVAASTVDPNPIVAVKGVDRSRDTRINGTACVEEELCKC
ncbi:hypothetical protein V6N13_068820 [Hibiscus sabdariffa]|uniref:Uncharacterized protein n=1 Tax=Hibiscus sabdariffa TaxID=183260 RepID=A0ABR2QP39_9ROSI